MTPKKLKTYSVLEVVFITISVLMGIAATICCLFLISEADSLTTLEFAIAKFLQFIGIIVFSLLTFLSYRLSRICKIKFNKILRRHDIHVGFNAQMKML